MYYSKYDCSYWWIRFYRNKSCSSLLELNHKVLVVEELDRQPHKFKNIESLDIVDCIGHDVFIKRFT